MSVSIKPLEDRIVVKSLEAEQTTASGLVIPDTAKEKPQEGEVLAVGPGRIDDKGNRVPLDISVGVIPSLGLRIRLDGAKPRPRSLFESLAAAGDCSRASDPIRPICPRSCCRWSACGPALCHCRFNPVARPLAGSAHRRPSCCG